MDRYKITVADLKRQLGSFNDDDEIDFEGGLSFNRLKRRGDKLVQIEFNEVQAYLDEKQRSKDSDIQVIFLKPEA